LNDKALCKQTGGWYGRQDRLHDLPETAKEKAEIKLSNVLGRTRKTTLCQFTHQAGSKKEALLIAQASFFMRGLTI
jgi:hypothetical protein